jgi:hypothetical protein
MITTLIIFYFILSQLYNLEKEYLMKVMVIICFANLIPMAIYTAVFLPMGQLNTTFILFWALI